MTIIIYGVMGLLATVVRSTMALHVGGMSGQLFDLNVPLIVALGLTGPFKRRLPAAILIGFWADCLSAVPFGFYVTFYGWYFAAIRGLGQMIQVDRALVIWLVLIAGVLFEYLSGFLFVPQFFHRFQLNDLLGQLLWATIFGSILVLIGRYCERLFQQQMNKIVPVD